MSPEDQLLTDITMLVEGVAPLDSLESDHLADVGAWLCTTNDVFRRQRKPAVPEKHLVAYFLVVDPVCGDVLLGDHLTSGLWLPPGGHVEPGEHPVQTVRRECDEELGVPAEFHHELGERPLFVTVTSTNDAEQHVDVSLWFVLELDRHQPVRPDEREYRQVRWWAQPEIRAADPALFDPHMTRMLDKLGRAVGMTSGRAHPRGVRPEAGGGSRTRG